MVLCTYPLYIATGLAIWFLRPAYLSWMIHFSMATVATPLVLGHVFMAIRPDLFIPLAEFKARMDTMIERFKDSQPGEGIAEVLMPGEPEARREAERLRTGVPLTDEVLVSLRGEAVSLGVPVPELSPTPLADGT